MYEVNFYQTGDLLLIIGPPQIPRYHITLVFKLFQGALNLHLYHAEGCPFGQLYAWPFYKLLTGDRLCFFFGVWFLAKRKTWPHSSIKFCVIMDTFKLFIKILINWCILTFMLARISRYHCENICEKVSIY